MNILAKYIKKDSMDIKSFPYTDEGVDESYEFLKNNIDTSLVEKFPSKEAYAESLKDMGLNGYTKEIGWLAILGEVSEQTPENL